MTLQTIKTTSWPISLAPQDWKNRHVTSAMQLKDAWGQFLGRIDWDAFVTLTFDPKRQFPVPALVASREAFWFFGLLGCIWRSAVGWLYAVERGSRGQWHAHGLAVGTKDRSWDAPKALWQERNGIIDVSTPIRSVHDVVLYTTKEACRTGDMTLSDTLHHYRHRLAPKQTVSLHPEQ